VIFFRKRRREAAGAAQARLGDTSVVISDESANFFGVESRGKAQVRGNGYLAASADEIVFVMWLPRRELTISRDRVTGVERTRSHLGKSVGRELLRVSFTNDAGDADSVAWLVRDVAAWEAALAPS
jgi:hypothetical protein